MTGQNISRIPLRLVPHNVLFFRDGRPMMASSIGNGARWPLPSVFHEALLTAFATAWPKPCAWERRVSVRAARQPGSDRKSGRGDLRFGALSTRGPFPIRGKQIFFPTPADIYSPVEGTFAVLQPTCLPGKGNLPDPLKYAPVPLKGHEPSKLKPPEWISAAGLVAYMNNAAPTWKPFVSPEHPAERDPLFDMESRPGVALDTDTQSALEGQFYVAQYARLRHGVEMIGDACCADSTGDAVARWLESGARGFCLGGQGGSVKVDRDGGSLVLPACAVEGRRVKWVLLSPAVFENRIRTTDSEPQGWLPGWVDRASGRVLLRDKAQDRRSILATLVSACIPKPIAFSGWDTVRQQPKATQLAVPAGAVYYFEADSPEDAKALGLALHGRCRSDRLGEKGFGLGVCGPWNLVAERGGGAG